MLGAEVDLDHLLGQIDFALDDDLKLKEIVDINNEEEPENIHLNSDVEELSRNVSNNSIKLINIPTGNILFYLSYQGD